MRGIQSQSQGLSLRLPLVVAIWKIWMMHSRCIMYPDLLYEWFLCIPIGNTVWHVIMKLSKKQISISYPKQDNNDFMKLKYVKPMTLLWCQISG